LGQRSGGETSTEAGGAMIDFKDKVVLITDPAQGFGRVLTNAFAERGAKQARRARTRTFAVP